MRLSALILVLVYFFAVFSYHYLSLTCGKIKVGVGVKG